MVRSYFEVHHTKAAGERLRQRLDLVQERIQELVACQLQFLKTLDFSQAHCKSLLVDGIQLHRSHHQHRCDLKLAAHIQAHEHVSAEVRRSFLAGELHNFLGQEHRNFLEEVPHNFLGQEHHSFPVLVPHSFPVLAPHNFLVVERHKTPLAEDHNPDVEGGHMMALEHGDGASHDDAYHDDASLVLVLCGLEVDGEIGRLARVTHDVVRGCT